MRNIRLFLLIGFATSVAFAQLGGTGSLQDPRGIDSSITGGFAFQPWLAVSGNYDNYLDNGSGRYDSARRSVSMNGGFSLAKSVHRTSILLGYGGSGSRYFGGQGSLRPGDWYSSNVGTMQISTQLTKRLIFDISEQGGAANGGFGFAAAGLQSSGLGVLGSLGLSSGALYGSSVGAGGLGAGLNPLENGLVDSDYFQQMTYFSSSSAGLGIMLTRRTMVNLEGSASFVRRTGRSYSDSNSVGSRATVSTYLTRRTSVFGGYSFQRINFIGSLGNTNMNGAFGGLQFKLSNRDSLSISASSTWLESKFITTVTLPDDVAALLGTKTTTTVTNNKQNYMGGAISYAHQLRKGGVQIGCQSSVMPGNDLILLSRTEACDGSLSHTLSRTMTVSAMGGYSRLIGLAQAGSRYDVFNSGVSFSYRVMREIFFTTGASYRNSTVRPSKIATEDVMVEAGLRWAPETHGGKH